MTAVAESHTVAPVPVPVDPPEGYWQREASHYPHPLSPVMRDLFVEPQNAVWANIASSMGMMIETIAFREIGGWMYQRLVPLGGKARKPLPTPVMWLMARTVPMLRNRIRKNSEVQRQDLGMQYIDRWYAQWRQEHIEAIARLRGRDLPSLSDADFDAHMAETSAFMASAMDVHFKLTTPVMTIAQLAFYCADELGWSDREVIELVAGLSVASTEPARRLAELAGMARERPAVRSLLEKVDASTLDRLREADPEFAKAFEAYQFDFGCRALRYEVVDPTLEEVPELTLGLIHDQLIRAYDPEAEASALRQQRERALARAREGLAGRPQQLAEFERLLARAEKYYPVREENEFYTISAPTALARYAVLEAGRRLVEKNLADRQDDAFFLLFRELREALRAGTDQRALVLRRRGERAWTLQNPGPASYGQEVPPPTNFDWLPKDVAFSMKATFWATDRIFGGTSQVKQVPSQRVKGIAAAPGTYTGPVRVILDESEFDKIQAGDVLVCPITSPVWSIIFPSVGALVTDTGGVLSHPAIISREYGVPAVVATGNGTQLLKDGQVVTVDGNEGVIIVQGA